MHRQQQLWVSLTTLEGVATITLAPPSVYSENIKPGTKETLSIADDLARSMDFDDVMFVALSLHLKCKMWTVDKLLMKSLQQKGFKRFITTKELNERQKK